MTAKRIPRRHSEDALQRRSTGDAVREREDPRQGQGREPRARLCEQRIRDRLQRGGGGHSCKYKGLILVWMMATPTRRQEEDEIPRNL